MKWSHLLKDFTNTNKHIFIQQFWMLAKCRATTVLLYSPWASSLSLASPPTLACKFLALFLGGSSGPRPHSLQPPSSRRRSAGPAAAACRRRLWSGDGDTQERSQDESSPPDEAWAADGQRLTERSTRELKVTFFFFLHLHLKLSCPTPHLGFYL